MLRKYGPPPDTLWDALLPETVRPLPARLLPIDQLLNRDEVLNKFDKHWGQVNRDTGRPSIPMATYLRMMFLKQQHGWGYEQLVYQVSDSLHLRRFCLIPLTSGMANESTLRKLTKRLGEELVKDLIREIITLAIKERGFVARAMRSDSTVQEADIRYPTDNGLLANTVEVLARGARRLRQLLPDLTRQVQDRSRAARKRMKVMGQIFRSRRAKVEEARTRQLMAELTGLSKASLGQAARLLEEAQERLMRGRHQVRGKIERAINDLQEKVDLGRKIVEQVRQRWAGEKITNRVVSLHDPSARPIRKGKRSKPTEFGSTVQYSEVNSNTRGARGLILPPVVGIGNVPEDKLLPQAVKEAVALGLPIKEAAFDALFTPLTTAQTMAPLDCEIIFISRNKKNSGSQRTQRRLASYRVGCEARISNLKRDFHGDRSRYKGEQGAKIWAAWTAFAYDIVTISRFAPRT